MNDTGKQLEVSAPLPWYALLLIGHALGGFVSWLLVIRQMYHRRSRNLVLILLAVNTVILAAYGYASVRVRFPWHNLLLFLYLSNLAWAAGAWLLQRKYLGAAPRRFRLEEWRNWISPITTAVVLSICLAVVIAIFPVLGERFQVIYADDILDKNLVLWDFFAYVPLFIPYGLLVGIWWAGEGRNFSAATILTYLFGLLVSVTILILLFQLFFFLVFKGHPYQGLQDWSVLPHGQTGLQGFLLKLDKYDQLAYVIAPLLLGSLSRIRDFWSRSLLLFPALFSCFLPLTFYLDDAWTLAQGHILHEMTSPDHKVRKKASHWAELLLARYPEHDRWPEFALLLARNSYENGEFAAARKYYGEVATRYRDSLRWGVQADFAGSVLSAAGFGTGKGRADIPVPLVNYESYLTPNWMALLQIIRYWSDAKTSESEILIRLKALSQSEEKIKLSAIPTLAELDDAAASLGFKVLILPADLSVARGLLRAEIPVLLPIYSYFGLLSGIDESRALLRANMYNKISERLREGDREEAREILSLAEEGAGESREQLRHIAAQSVLEIEDAFWGSALQKDSTPFMAVVYPGSAAARIAEALPGRMEELQQKSKGYLAGLIAMNALGAADPVQCIKWAMLSRQFAQEPFALHVAYLAERLWKSRDTLVQSRLDLDRQFPPLAVVQEFFVQDSTRVFLDEARRQFEADRAGQNLTWRVRNEYAELLDRSNPAELGVLIDLFRQSVAVSPNHRRAWLDLAELYEWQDDVDLMISALEGALAADTWNDEIALLLAYRYVQAGREENARKMMARIDPAGVGINPHYLFCQGALANWDGKTDAAMDYYAKAIEMRRSVPLYHLHYGEMLLKEGRKEEARKALQWAIQVDITRGRVRAAAQSLLNTI